MNAKPINVVSAVVFAVGIAALLAQTGARAQQGAPTLSYARAFLQTGNFVVSSIDLPRGGGSASLSFSGSNAVPPNAEISAAFLYWEALGPAGASFGPAKFHGRDITTAKASRLTQLPSATANCWGSSGNANRVLTMYRADVLNLWPKQYDANNRWTGRYLVNGISHPVELGISGGGNTLTTIAGATLLLVYRDLSEPLRKIVIYDGVHAQVQGTTTTQTIAGFYRSSASQSARLAHIAGSGARNTSERLLFNGQPLNITNPIPNPVGDGSDRGWASPVVDVSDRMPGSNWEIPGVATFGEAVTTGVDHGANNVNAAPYECLAWAAMVFSTSVDDTDADGLPDAVEEVRNPQMPLSDPPTPAYPNGQPLPDLFEMGARIGQRDLIVEINAMTAASGTTYGSAAAPFSSATASLTDHVGHNHTPTPAVLKMVGDSYLAGGIHVHFDVGSWARYQALGPEYQCLTGPTGSECDARPYLVPTASARGGEFIAERASPTGQFSAYPGTVGWPFGVQLYKDAPVGDDGEERSSVELREGNRLADGTLVFDSWDKGERRRRFDRNRQDYVHYALYAHARGKARPPCFDPVRATSAEYNGRDPVTNEPTESCVAPLVNNPQFPHVPFSGSGVAALPGGDALITLGLWDTEFFVGSPFLQASTSLHELGHNLNLWHGGKAAQFGNSAVATRVEPNCKPNYLSSMSYLFQVHGLFDNSDEPHLDYSFGGQPALTETTLNEVPLSGATYRTAWYVPVGTQLANAQGASAARRFCDGGAFSTTTTPNPLYARVQASQTDSIIDWDGQPGSSAGDINFDGSTTGVLESFDDWGNLRLDQIRAGRIARVFRGPDGGDLLDFGSGDLLDFGSGDLLDFGSGDLLDFGSGTHVVHLESGDFLRVGNGDLLDFGSGDLLDFGSGTFMTDGAAGGSSGGDLLDFGSGDLLDFGSGDLLDFGSGDLLDFGSGDLLDFGSGDLLDFGSGDLLDFGSGTGLQELDLDTARALGRPRPYALNAFVLTAPAAAPYPGNLHRVQLTWRRPTFDVVTTYEIYRVAGDVSPSGSVQPLYLVAAPDTTFVDPEVLPDGVTFTYWVRAVFADGTRSPNSDRAVVVASNTPPVAVKDDPSTGVVYTTAANTSLRVPAAGVIANDTDVDGPVPSGLRAIINGVQVNADGSFTSLTRTVTINADGSFTATTMQGGRVTLQRNGAFTYQPKNGFQGTDRFAYRVDNGVWSRDNAVLMSAPPLPAVDVEIVVTSRRR